MSMFLAMLLKPFVGFVLWGIAWLIAGAILRSVPNGRFRRLLTRRIGRGHANKARDRASR